MKMAPPSAGFALVPVLLLSACLSSEQPEQAVGQLASDRVEIAFEARARILERGPAEGSRVDPETVLFVLDAAEIDLQLRAAEARVDELAAVLAELVHGTRSEVLARTRSEQAGARDTLAFRTREVERMSALEARALLAPSALDAARTAQAEARSKLTGLDARLGELTAGPRPEVIDRARAALAATRAERDRLALLRQRHRVVAGVHGQLDRYVFEVGEWGHEGAVGAVVLTGAQPHASVFLPAAMRARVRVGDAVAVRVEGFAAPLDGRVRWISSEAAFTPYFALTESDRGRLSFRAEIRLETPADRRLPDGLPVAVTLVGEG